MPKKLIVLSVCAAALLLQCSVEVFLPPQTTIRAENDLTAMSVEVNGASTEVTGIDLAGVTIGDVFFSSIDYGTITAAKATNRSGEVAVNIDEALVWTKVLGVPVSLSFPNITPMSTRIISEKENTVVFDETTAGVIFQALAKRNVSKTL
ncbi:MAG: hypothetical protein MUF22_09825 [Chitinispirillaceae bacterium]|nr:hypothetical protein [Chitinispirillaceae bacterium]